MKSLGFGFGIIIIVLWLAGFAGWLMNIVQIFEMSDMVISAMFIIKCIGIFVAPLGAVLGWVG